MQIDPARGRQLLVAARRGTPIASPRSAGTASMQKPLGATEQQQLASLRAALDQLTALRGRLQTMGPERWNRAGGTSRSIGGVETAGAPTRQWQRFARAHGMSLAGNDDPETAELNRMIGQITTAHATATSALMKSAGTRNYQFAQDVQGHLPDPAADYTTNMTNLDYLLSDKGPYQSMIRGMGVQAHSIPSAVATPSASGTSGTPDPVADLMRKHGVSVGP
jgi:hypothetical protein